MILIKMMVSLEIKSDNSLLRNITELGPSRS